MRSSQPVPEQSVAERQQRELNSSSNGSMVAQHENDPQVYEELIPCAYGRICGTALYYRRPFICMVDPACDGEAQPHHWKAEVEVLGLNAQV